MDKETSEREALLPCPWCGGTRICPDQFLAPHEIEANGGKYAWTMCCEEPACGYMTATYRTLEEARAAWNRRAPPSDQWIPVTERMPDDETEVLTFGEADVVPGFVITTDDGPLWYDYGGTPMDYQPTHWSHYPEPPKEPKP